MSRDRNLWRGVEQSLSASATGDQPMTTHTPGPWAIKHDVEIKTEGYTCALIHRKGDKNQGTAWIIAQPNYIANARLIAAAPEMLALLTTIWETMPPGSAWAHKTSEQIQTLLARIEGGK